ncbi:MAG: RnfABCDGE type electron transport complex subunit G [Nitrospirota bacterium]
MGRLILILTAICISAAFALANIYEITKGPIAEQKRLKVRRSLDAVLPEYNNNIEDDIKEVITGKDKRGNDVKVKFYIGRSDEQVVGTAFVVVAPDGYGDKIEIMMGVNHKREITGIEILSHRETPGLGERITNKEWRDSFKGRSVANTRFSVKKDGGDIDQFTGATISPRAVVKAVKRGLEFYQKNEGLFD